MKILSWNIHGGIIEGSSGSEPSLEYYSAQILKCRSDIVALQESHTPLIFGVSQGASLAHRCGFPYVVNRPISPSHLKSWSKLSLAILSKFPILGSNYHQLTNPGLIHRLPSGTIWKSHDKGVLSAQIDYRGTQVTVMTLHFSPLHAFKRDWAEPEFKAIRDEVSRVLLKTAKAPTIILGDFNYERIEKIFAPLFKRGAFEEAFFETPTTLGGSNLDHVLFSKHWKLKKARTISGLSDHYICYADLELK